MLDQLDDNERSLKELDGQAGYPHSDVREDAQSIIDGMREGWPRAVTANTMFTRPRRRKGAAFRARIPKAPRPSYRANLIGGGPYQTQEPVATLTDVTAPPPPAPEPTVVPAAGASLPKLPENWKELPEPEKIASLENLLKYFQLEHKKIMDKHASAIQQINQQVKERKLAELRDTLNATP
jgi:hypothetical protein